MNKKYEIINGHCVALRDFGNVKKGEVGGRLESEKNLSHRGNAWVSDDARVYGNAWVYGNAEQTNKENTNLGKSTYHNEL